MLKKLILIIFSIFFIACSNTMTVVDSDQKEEIIKQAISTPKKDVILLGNNYDYLFTGEEARKLLTLIDFLNIKGLTKENIGRIRKNITINSQIFLVVFLIIINIFLFFQLYLVILE